jgi:zinc transport system substrate-binding protein
LTKTRYILALLVLCLYTNGLAAERPVVWGTTTMIGEMLSMVGGGIVDVRTLIPPRSCPGHFDLSPGDAMEIAGAGLIFRHDFQAYLDRRLSAQNPDLEIEIVKAGGQVLLPSSVLRSLTQVRDILSRRFPENESRFAANHDRAAREVESTAELALEQAKASGLTGVKVLGSVMQQGMLRWVGMDVVEVFPNSPDELSVRKLAELLDIARGGGIRIIAGNLQSGGEAVARTLGSQTGLPVAILSNFPGTGQANRTYRDLLLDDIGRLARAASAEIP